MRQSVIILLLLFDTLFFSRHSNAADVALDLNLSSVDRHVTLTLSNRSSRPVEIADFRLELNRQIYPILSSGRLAAHSGQTYRLDVSLPDLPGSYLIHAKLHYRNDDILLTLQNTGIFYVKQRSPLTESCRFEEAVVNTNRRHLRLIADAGPDWRLYLPDELAVLKHSFRQDVHDYWLNAPPNGLVNRYTVYAGAERIAGGVHQATLCQTQLLANGQFGSYTRGRIPDAVLYGLSGGSLAILAVLGLTVKSRSDRTIPYNRYFARLFFLGLAYLLLRHAPIWIDTLNSRPWASLNLLSEHFEGDSYRFFFEYFADAYLLTYLVFGLPYFLFFAHPSGGLQEDKYYALIRSFASMPRLLLLQRPEWNYLSRLGLLTLLVKLFFLPYMVSWGIQNIKHLIDLYNNGVSGFHQYNDLLQTVFMLIDTGIFAFGYLVESRRLDSEIKSVDPTFLGWLVCLWCYPPFNSFSFRYFDYPLFDIHIKTPEIFQMAMSAAVTALWGIFCIASINLGFKASNLTNRGIVRHGLYRYVRHPAYACKILAWVIQGVFLGQFTLGILLAFTAIYVLRALTEEWHLGRDSDYLAYKQAVPRRFIPGVL